MHTLLRFGAVVALVLSLAGCGSDDDPEDSEPTRASSDGTDASSPDEGDESEAPDTQDCATTDQAAQFSINGQLVSQFANLPTSSWSDTLGKLDELDEEVEALSTLEGDEVQDALAIYAQIPPIIEAGLGGDATATEKLAALIGTDPVEALKIKNTIVLAYGQQCQGAG